MDAISFVLGVKTAQLRSTQLKDLVFRAAALAPEGAGEGAAADDEDAPDRASVTAVIEDAKGVEHRFQRTITPAGSSEFRYNGRVVSYTLYNQRLEQLNILVKARNFLVFQGDVEAIAAQCSKDLSEVVDEVSGSRALAGEYDAARTAYDASVAHSSALVTKRKNLLAEVRAFRQQKEAADRLDAVKLELHAHLVQQMLWRLYHIHEITEIHTDWIEAHAARNEQLRRRHDEREAQVATARADAGRVQQAILAQEAEEKKLTRAIDAARPEREKLEERLAHAQHKRKQAATLCAQAERDRDAHDATLARLERLDHQLDGALVPSGLLPATHLVRTAPWTDACARPALALLAVLLEYAALQDTTCLDHRPCLAVLTPLVSWLRTHPDRDLHRTALRCTLLLSDAGAPPPLVRRLFAMLRLDQVAATRPWAAAAVRSLHL